MAPFNETMCLISGPVQDTQPRVQPPPTPLTTSIAQAAYPLTKSQESMWNQYIANPTTICHNLTLELDLNKCGETQTSISEVTRGRIPPREAIPTSPLILPSHKRVDSASRHSSIDHQHHLAQTTSCRVHSRFHNSRNSITAERGWLYFRGSNHGDAKPTDQP